MKINTEKNLTKTQRRKTKNKNKQTQRIEEYKKNKRRNRKFRQNNKLKSVDINLKESRHKRDIKRIYGENYFQKKI
jgi:hypothetical protein